MKRQSHQREVIVLGSGLGGLIAGTILAKKNFSVQMLKEREYQPFFVKKGYRFTSFSNFSEIHLSPTFIDQSFQEWDFSFSTLARNDGGEDRMDEKLKQEAFSQVILPKSRIDLFCERSLLQREWEREFPEELSQIEDFYNELDQMKQILKGGKNEEKPPGLFPIREPSMIKRMFSLGILQKGNIRDRLSLFSKEFRQFIRLQLISQGNFFPDKIPMDLAAHLLLNGGESNKRAWHIELEKLEQYFLKQFSQSGGTVEEIESLEHIDKERRKGFILSLGREHGALHSEFLILNLPLHRLLNRLNKERLRLSKWEKKSVLRYILIPLFLGIREKVVPVGMKDLLVSILDLSRPFGGGNVIFISLSPKGDEAKAPDGRRALTVEILVPIEKWNAISQIEYQKEAMRHITQLFPFLENHIEFVDLEWNKEQTQHWSYPHYIYENSSHFSWREGVIPPSLSSNLFLTGKENFPYLGLEGEILSGLMAAKNILKKYS